MSSNLSIKRLTLVLSKHLSYGIIPISLMGMMPGGGPPGDPYIQAYNTLTARYAATNQNTNQLLNNYSAQLLDSANSMADGAQEAFVWAQRQRVLARNDSNTLDIIRQRIAIMLGYIGRHAKDAQGRSAAVQANVPGSALLPGDQNILNALNQANVIDEQAQLELNQAQAEVNQIQNFIQDINNRLNAIQQRINQMNQPVLGVNYTNADVLAYNQALTAIKNDSNHINQRAFATKESTLRVNNYLNNIRQLIQNIYQLGNNLGIQMPAY